MKTSADFPTIFFQSTDRKQIETSRLAKKSELNCKVLENHLSNCLKTFVSAINSHLGNITNKILATHISPSIQEVLLSLPQKYEEQRSWLFFTINAKEGAIFFSSSFCLFHYDNNKENSFRLFCTSNRESINWLVFISASNKTRIFLEP